MDNVESVYPAPQQTSMSDTGRPQTGKRVEKLKRHVLKRFKKILRKRSRTMLKKSLTDANTFVCLGNTLYYLVKAEPHEVEKWQRLTNPDTNKSEYESSGRSDSTKSPASSSTRSSRSSSSSTTTTATSTTGRAQSEYEAESESESASAFSTDYGRPLKLHQAVSHLKVDANGNKVMIVYEQIASGHPPKQTPTRRLSRRS